MSRSRSWNSIPLPGSMPAPVGAYSPIVRAGDFLYVSGQVPTDPASGNVAATDIEGQTRYVIEKLRFLLQAAGASLDDVVSVTAYLQDENDWPAFNDVYRATFSAPYPTRTAIGARLRDVLVEVSAVAYAPRS